MEGRQPPSSSSSPPPSVSHISSFVSHPAPSLITFLVGLGVLGPSEKPLGLSHQWLAGTLFFVWDKGRSGRTGWGVKRMDGLVKRVGGVPMRVDLGGGGMMEGGQRVV